VAAPEEVTAALPRVPAAAAAPVADAQLRAAVTTEPVSRQLAVLRTPAGVVPPSGRARLDRHSAVPDSPDLAERRLPAAAAQLLVELPVPEPSVAAAVAAVAPTVPAVAVVPVAAAAPAAVAAPAVVAVLAAAAVPVADAALPSLAALVAR